MSKHTPGPWVIFKGEIDFDVMPAMRPGNICESVVSEGDAYLIAAAPRMLAALKAVIDGDEDDYDILTPDWQEAVDAVRQAEGRLP